MNFEKEPTPSQPDAATSSSHSNAFIGKTTANIKEFTSYLSSKNERIISEDTLEIALLYCATALNGVTKKSVQPPAIARTIDLLESLHNDNYPLSRAPCINNIRDSINQLFDGEGYHPSFRQYHERWRALCDNANLGPSADIYMFPDQTPSDPQE